MAMEMVVFLTHFDAAGGKEHTALELYDATSTFYLPNVLTSPLNVSREKDLDHSDIRLDICSQYCLLTVYGDDSGPTTVLADIDVKMPVSTPHHQKSFILTEDHQFTTSTGRWRVEWDEFGDISNSMRPPPLPEGEHDMVYEEDMEHLELVISQGQGRLVSQEEMDDISDEEHAPIPVTEIRLSPRSIISEDEVRGAEVQNQVQPQVQADINILETNQMTAIEIDAHESEKAIIGEANKASATLPTTSISPTDNMTKGIEDTHRDTHMNTSNEDQSAEVHGGEQNDTNMLVDTAAAQTISQDDANLSKTTPTDDEETASESEDESQRMKDSRVPKRRMLEIEAEDSLISSKRQKIAVVAEQQTAPKQKSSGQGNREPIVTPAAGKVAHIQAARSSGRKRKAGTKETSKSRLDSEPKAMVEKVPSATAAPSTPARRSTRHRSETPVSSSKLDTADYGRPTVIFGSSSTIPKNKRMMSIIEKLGGTIVTDIVEADILCIGKGEMKKTSKFVIAVAKGKDIVTDEWVKQANSEQKFPEREAYLPKDNKHEKEWGFKLSDALARGRQGLNILENVQIHMTTQLCKDLGSLTKELKHVASALGATQIQTGLPKKHAKGQILVVRSTKNVDPEAYKVQKLGYKLYGQDILTMAALRGRVEMDSEEFVIKVPVKDEPSSQ